MPDFTPDYFSAHLTDDPAKEPVAVGESISRIIADAANKLGRDVKTSQSNASLPSNFRRSAVFVLLRAQAVTMRVPFFM